MNTHTPDLDPAADAPPFPLDRFDAEDLAESQQALTEQLTRLIDELAASLELDHDMRADAPAGSEDLAGPGLPHGVASLQSASRWREAQARQRKRLAQDMVFSALRNLDNPDWHVVAADRPEAAGGAAFLQALLAWTAPA
ncbi:MAG: hypothetical protein V4754_19760 [Pseudomonadota bacterium]